MNLSSFLKVYRKKNGMTQKQLAEAVNVTVLTITRLESGKQRNMSSGLKESFEKMMSGEDYEGLLQALETEKDSSVETLLAAGGGTKENVVKMISALEKSLKQSSYSCISKSEESGSFDYYAVFKDKQNHIIAADTILRISSDPDVQERQIISTMLQGIGRNSLDHRLSKYILLIDFNMDLSILKTILAGIEKSDIPMDISIMEYNTELDRIICEYDINKTK